MVSVRFWVLDVMLEVFGVFGCVWVVLGWFSSRFLFNIRSFANCSETVPIKDGGHNNIERTKFANTDLITPFAPKVDARHASPSKRERGIS